MNRQQQFVRVLQKQCGVSTQPNTKMIEKKNLYLVPPIAKKIYIEKLYSNKFQAVIRNKNQILFQRYQGIGTLKQINQCQKIINMVKVNQWGKKIFVHSHNEQEKDTGYKQPLFYLNSFVKGSEKNQPTLRESTEISIEILKKQRSPIKNNVEVKNEQSIQLVKQMNKCLGGEKKLGMRTESARLQTQKLQQLQKCQPNKNTRNHHQKLYSLCSQHTSGSTYQYNHKQPPKQPHNIIEYKKQLIFIPPKITSKSYLVCQLLEDPITKTNNIQIHLSHNSKVRTEVASLTKIMTCIIAIEICEKQDINPHTEQIKIGKFESSIGGTSANLQLGDVYSLHDLLHGLMLPSGNDASLAIAVWGGKKLIDRNSRQQYYYQPPPLLPKKKLKKQYYQRFIQEMNSKTVQLKMVKTNYANSHGLVNLFNRSCAHDIAVLAGYCMRNQYFRNVVACRRYENIIRVEGEGGGGWGKQSWEKNGDRNWQQQQDKQGRQYQNMDSDTKSNISNGEETAESVPALGGSSQYSISYKKILWQNTHKLLQKRSEEYIGIKTGVTNSAGYCLCSCVRTECGRQLFIVVLNCKKLYQRFKQTEILKKWVYRKLGVKGSGNGEMIKEMDVHVEVSGQENYSQNNQGEVEN